MNIDNWSKASPPSKIAGAMLRAGFTDVQLVEYKQCEQAKFSAPPLEVVPSTTTTNTNVNTISVNKPPNRLTPGFVPKVPSEAI